MGYDAVSFTVHARLSRHNDERDVRDNQFWEEIREEIESYLENYPEINAMVAP